MVLLKKMIRIQNISFMFQVLLTITEGDKVEFELKEGNKGLNAINVVITSPITL